MKLLAGILFALPLLAAPPFTIDQLLSTPFPTELVASPRSEAFAWIADDRGVRNVWLARGPAFTPSAVTKFTADDGQDIGDLTWKPDGSALFFTRGTGTNSRGELANPMSDPDGGQQSVWMVNLTSANAEPAELSSGHMPSVAPDGSAVAYISNGLVWVTPLAPGAASARLIVRGSAKALAWSPDSTRLAFTSDRGDHAFIAIYSLHDKSLRYFDPTADSDQSPVWSPDGSEVAFIRIPALRDAAAWGAKPSGQPWSIRIGDVASGKSRELWRARSGVGSVFWPMTAHSQLMWTAGGRIVFPWEGDGWLHLYSVPSRGGAPALLTPGDFEIEDVTATPDGKSLIYSSNQDDADRRHLWRVSPDDGKPARLSTGSGIEWSPAVTSSGRIAVIRSDAKTPARPALLEDGVKLRDLVPIPATFPSAALVGPQPILYTSPDGARIHSQLFLPPPGAGRKPAVIFFHGGARRQMLLGFHYMGYYHQAYAFNQYLAAQGYIVLSVNYRAGIGYGQAFRETSGYGATGAVEYNDVLGAASYLHSRGDVDPARIGLWGGSYGGYLTALGLARNSDLFAAGVDIHGIHDWNLEITNTIPESDSARRQQVFRTAFESSPLASVAKWRSPVLLVQGDDDRNVAFANTPQLVEALRRQGVPFEQIVFPDEIHEFLVHAHWLTTFHAAADFLAKYLKP